jgi:hypothetical protein
MELFESFYPDISEYAQSKYKVEKKVCDEKKEKCFLHMVKLMKHYRSELRGKDFNEQKDIFFQMICAILMRILVEHNPACEKTAIKQNMNNPNFERIVEKVMDKILE